MVTDALMKVAAALNLTLTLTPADPETPRPVKPRIRSL